MKIIDFIKKNKNWKELLSKKPYSLLIKEKDNLLLFNYSQIDSQPNEITREARGLILEKDTWRVIRYGFNRFFNLGEEYADFIDWESATASNKEDGTLIFAYYYNGWHIGTRSTFDAIEAPLSSPYYKNFKELFDVIAKLYHLNFNILNQNYTYCFELCSCYNMIVIQYVEPKLFHIFTRDMRTLEEVEDDIGIPKPAQYNLASQDDYEKLVSTFDETHEGIVIKDKFNHRVKMKTQLYFELHRIVNNGNITYERALDLILANEDSELLAYFPQYRDFFGIVRTDYTNAQRVVDWIDYYVQQWKKEDENPTLPPYISHKPTGRKGFAQWVKLYYPKWSSVCFLAYEGRLQERREQLKTAKEIMRFYHIGDKK